MSGTLHHLDAADPLVPSKLQATGSHTERTQEDEEKVTIKRLQEDLKNVNKEKKKVEDDMAKLKADQKKATTEGVIEAEGQEVPSTHISRNCPRIAGESSKSHLSCDSMRKQQLFLLARMWCRAYCVGWR